ncbi:hypothetical protein H206_00115 [Candidatus Electrothrix aarhusensis]|uniref:Uncharacterized protein n=1 Tax=Candidatus Electrothrix aarhusensis TaxID=1859131 RepID=A0A3S3RRE0_9BACT|nr:hypothetical protein H206_00115 [Candidatus Electrothrix aarhusensis]
MVKPIEFDGFKKQAGLNSFTLTPKYRILGLWKKLSNSDFKGVESDSFIH